MKKQLKSNLSLNKFTVASLDDANAQNVKGGFTYSLSMGTLCRYSKSKGALNPFQCGQLTPKQTDIPHAFEGGPVEFEGIEGVDVA